MSTSPEQTRLKHVLTDFLAALNVPPQPPCYWSCLEQHMADAMEAWARFHSTKGLDGWEDKP